MTKTSTILLLALFALSTAACASSELDPSDRADSVAADPVDERFYADERADSGRSLGLDDSEERALLLFVNSATMNELDMVSSCSVRAVDSILAWRRNEGAIRSLYELDAVPYVGVATFRGLLEHVRTKELVEDVTFWDRLKPEMMETVASHQTLVFGGPTGKSRWLRSFRLNVTPGDRVAFRLTPLDGTAVNTRIDIEAADDSMRRVENPYSLKEARLPAEDQAWHDGIRLDAEEYVVSLQNRGAPGQYLFEMRCVGGPCASQAAAETGWDFLFRGDLRGSKDMAFSRSGIEDGAELPDALQNLEDDALLAELAARHAANHREMTYDQARELVFALLHNVEGVVTGVYSGVSMETESIPHAWVMNTEHAWPRSRGVSGAFISDLHHLYPAVSRVNSARADYQYCEVAELIGLRGEARWGYDADGFYCFEPRDSFKGNAARTLFYISAAYGLEIDSGEEALLRRWHEADPVDVAEADRNDAVAELQGSRNLFVDAPQLVERVADF